MDRNIRTGAIKPCPAERDSEAAAFLRTVLYQEFGFTPDPLLDKDFNGLVGHYRRGRGEVWIATDGNRIVATTALLDMAFDQAGASGQVPSGGDAELKRMFVHSSQRGRGIGRRLLAVAIEHAIGAGFDRILLDSTRDMRPAIALYRAAGFSEIADYNGNQRADIFMALCLPRPAR